MMVEVTKKVRPRHAASGAARLPADTPLLLYPIARDGGGTMNLLCVPIAFREEALVVFSSREAARDSLVAQVRQGERSARVCSGGELVSLLFGPYKDVDWVLFDPLPGRRLEEAAETNLVSRGRFVDYLLGRPEPQATRTLLSDVHQLTDRPGGE